MEEVGVAETSPLPVEPSDAAGPDDAAAKPETLGEEPTEPTPAEPAAENLHDPTPDAPDEKKTEPEDSALGSFLEELDLQ